MKNQSIPFSSTHLILIPSYNTGAILQKTVAEILGYHQPVWVVIDGSDDGSEQTLISLEKQYADALYIIHLPENKGKGAAILTGIESAHLKGFSHVLTMDADFQHSAESIGEFIEKSQKNPEAMILGNPIFEESAPALRVQGRRISNAWVNLETLNWGIEDSLFGMRVYPIEKLIAVMHTTKWARGFDFEPEVVVNLAWTGVKAININTPVRYLGIDEGGVSQFRYLRDNILLIGMHTRLFLGFLNRLVRMGFGL
ncbi:MAG: glycosyltransferase family 2 protein [Methylococcales bacterium]|nr:glycosyltransferase family 2 protein [Methylococcales bacterium]